MCCHVTSSLLYHFRNLFFFHCSILDWDKVHERTTSGVIATDVAKASLRGPLQAGPSQGPRRPWTLWQSPRKDLAKSIFHQKNVDHSVFQQGCAVGIFIR